MVRGLAVGVLTWAVALFFTGFQLAARRWPPFGFLLLPPTCSRCWGCSPAVWAEKFEQINFFPTFVMLPLTFLGGVFYSVQPAARAVAHLSLFNPMVYMVEGLRYGMLGTSALPPGIGALMLVLLALGWRRR